MNVKLNIDLICEDLIEGIVYEDIAKKYSVSYGTLHAFISNNDNSARVIVARQQSADAFDTKAERVLMDLQAGGTNADIARARELASHYRWRASKRNPKVFGDKVELSGNADAPLQIITGMRVINTLPAAAEPAGLIEDAEILPT